MSTEAFGYRGFGIKTESDFIPPKFSRCEDFGNLYSIFAEQKLLIDDVKKSKDGQDIYKFGVIMDGMCGEYNFYGFILQAHYIEDTHGDGYWHKEFQDDEWIRTEGAKMIKETFGFEEEPKIYDHLEIWN